jgi:hypothetical protein
MKEMRADTATTASSATRLRSGCDTRPTLRRKAIRAFLCVDCNHGLGRFCDDPALLRAAAGYTERFRGTAA